MIFDIDGIWFSVVVAELAAAVMTVLFIAAKKESTIIKAIPACFCKYLLCLEQRRMHNTHKMLDDEGLF